MKKPKWVRVDAPWEVRVRAWRYVIKGLKDTAIGNKLYEEFGGYGDRRTVGKLREELFNLPSYLALDIEDELVRENVKHSREEPKSGVGTPTLIGTPAPSHVEPVPSHVEPPPARAVVLPPLSPEDRKKQQQ